MIPNSTEIDLNIMHNMDSDL